MIICFNGIDGSGKSSQAERLVDQLNMNGYPAVHLWLGGTRLIRRPLIRWTKRAMGLSSTRKMRQEQATKGTDGGRYEDYLDSLQPYFKHWAVRNAWLHSSLMEHALEIWLRMAPHLQQGKIVICDRYLHDSIVRLAVLSQMEIEQFARQLKLLRLYRVPAPTIQFLIDVPATVAYERKNDIPDQRFLQLRIPLYRCLAERMGMVVIDGTGSPDEIAREIWQALQPVLQGRPSTVPPGKPNATEMVEVEE